MDAYIADFVNREEALGAIWDDAKSAQPARIWLVSGPDGIGKSYLLDECRTRSYAEHVHCLYLDLQDPELRSVPTTIMHLVEQFGAEHFPRTLEAAATATALAQPRTPDTGAPMSSGAGDTISGTVHAVDAGGMVAVGKDITQISGAVVHYVTQVVRYDDPLVQQQAAIRLTQALQADLQALTERDRLLLLVDGWSADNSEIKRWLCNHLLSWIAGQTLTSASAVLAEATELPKFPYPAQVGTLTLQELTEDAVTEYWVGRRKLPADKVADVLLYSGGVPLILMLIANRLALQSGRAAA